MILLEAFKSNAALLNGFSLFLGLCVGSFLNVLAWRLPKMIEQEFRDACHEQFGCPPDDAQEVRVTLSRPRSSCMHCQAPIRAWHNIPVLGWLMLRGRCADCNGPISIQYPIVELVTGLLSLACAVRFGADLQLVGALLLTWSLVALTVTDLRTLYLPDQLTLPLIWLGLLFACGSIFVDPVSGIIGAVAGYLSLWLVFHGFRLLTGKEGMGHGDFKLLSALGAWLGWQALPEIVLLSACVGATVGISLMLVRRAEWTSRLPFGPYLAGAGWIALMWGDDIVEGYMRYSGLSG